MVPDKPQKISISHGVVILASEPDAMLKYLVKFKSKLFAKIQTSHISVSHHFHICHVSCLLLQMNIQDRSLDENIISYLFSKSSYNI